MTHDSNPNHTAATKPQLILASQSPRRRELLRLCGFPYTCCSVELDEEQYLPTSEPLSLEACQKAIQELARAKAQLACQNLPLAASHTPYCVLGCDTVLWFQGKILGKPRNPEDAFDMLCSLQGHTHLVLTACALIDSTQFHQTQLSLESQNTQTFQAETFVHETAVTFGVQSEAWLRSYIQTGSPMDKAGSYGIQDAGALLVERIEGDYYSVMGLPVASLYPILCRHLGYAPLPSKKSDELIPESATAE